MAYIDDENKDKDQTTPGQGLKTSGVVGSTTGSAGGGQGNTATAPTSTGFVNLDQYLGANQGVGAKLASDATKGLVADSDAYKQNAADTSAKASQDFTAANGSDTAQGIKSGIQSNASGVLNRGQQFLSSQYSGPKAADYTSNLDTNSQALQSKLQGVGDYGTQASLLKDAYGKNQPYTTGFQNLDQFLLAGDQSGKDAIKGVQARAGDVAAANSTADQSIQNAYTNAQQAYGQNQAAVRGAAHDTLQGSLNDANAAVAAKNATLNRDYLGTANASIGDVLTPEQRANMEALAALSGDQRGDWDTRTFNAGHARPVVVQPAPVQQGSSGGDNYDPMGGTGMAMAKAGNDVAQGAKTDVQTRGTPIQAPPLANLASNTAKATKKSENKAVSFSHKVFSDMRLKANIEAIPESDLREFFANVQPYFYTYINQSHGEGIHPGFMAQDLLKSKLGRTIVSENEDGHLQVDTWKLMGALTGAMKYMLESK